MKSVAKFGFVSSVLLALFLVAGCESVPVQLTQSRDAVNVVLEEAKGVSEDTKAAIASLPANDPVRVQLEAKLKQADDLIVKAKQAVLVADAAIEAAETGTVPPQLTTLLTGVPYGSYVLVALSLAVALKKRADALKTNAALRKVVASWDAVGEDLTAEEKKEVSDIQGPTVTAIVHDIKADFSSK